MEIKAHLLNDQTFNKYFQKEIEVFLECNRNSASHSAIWKSILAYLRGLIISFTAQKRKEKQIVLTTLEHDIHKLEKEHAQTKLQNKPLTETEQIRILYFMHK